MPRIEKKIEKKKDQISKKELQARSKEEMKTVALGTSKINYMDPRITIAWCVCVASLPNRAFSRDENLWLMSSSSLQVQAERGPAREGLQQELVGQVQLGHGGRAGVQVLAADIHPGMDEAVEKREDSWIPMLSSRVEPSLSLSQ